MREIEREKLSDATWHPITRPFIWLSKIADMPQVSSILSIALKQNFKIFK